MAKRTGLLFVLVLVCLGGTVGVQAKTKISYWTGWMNAVMFETEQEIVEMFMEENPDIEVEFSQPPDIITRFPIAVATNTMPDVVVVNFDDFPAWYDMGAYYDLRPLIATDPDMSEDDFVPWVIDFYDRDGGLWGLALTAYARGLAVYNPRLLEEAGLHLPDFAEWNWDAFRTYASKLTLHDGGRLIQEGARLWYHPMGLQTWFWSNGAQVFNEDFTGVRLTEPVAIETIAFIQDLALQGLAPVQGLPDGQSLGRVAMHIGSGGWDFPNWEMQEEELGVPTRIMWHPWNGEPRKVSMLGGQGVAICATTENVEAAWRLVKYLAKPEIQLLRAQNGYGGVSNLELYRDAVVNKRFSLIEPVEIYWELLFTGQLMPAFPKYRNWNSLWNQMQDQLLKGEISPMEFATVLTERSNRLLGGVR